MTSHEDRYTYTAVTQRMAGDMKIRRLAPGTIDAYTYHVSKFAQFLGKPLDQATTEDVRNFQLYLVEDRQVGWSSFNQAVCGLRFLYSITLPKCWPVAMIPFGKRPRRLPVVLSVEEVDALLQCTPNHKQRTFLMILYAAGLRLSEASHLTISDIDSQRMQLRVARGKGDKERLVPFSPRLLGELREYWKAYRPSHFLFPGQTPDRPYAAPSIQKAIKVSATRARIRKNVTPHVLRHSFATSLLEAGVDLLTISRLLGHSSFTTTMVYLHVRRPHLASTPSPLDWLPVRQLPLWQQAQESHGTDNLSSPQPPAGPSPTSSAPPQPSTSPRTPRKPFRRYKAR